MRKLLAALLAAAMCMTILTPLALAEETPQPDAVTAAETAEPSATPTTEPTAAPTTAPTAEPTATPTVAPTTAPTAAPTVTPTAVPIVTPTVSPEPTTTPTATPASDATPLPEGTEQRITMGADLTSAQRAAVYKDFGVVQGTVTELIVTNAEEKAVLKDVVPEKKIGSVALSCIFITTLPKGQGLNVELHNINYCTADMYVNALTTAGITDAKVIVSAPYPVSGTGALTGAYKAYEDITGTSLSSLAKAVGAEELVITGELAEYIGSDDATEIIGELKGMLDQTVKMTDAEVREEIEKLAKAYNVVISSDQVAQVLALVRKLEGLDTEALQDRLVGLAKAAQGVNAAGETVSRVFENVKGFFVSVGNFLSGLFGNKATAA